MRRERDVEATDSDENGTVCDASACRRSRVSSHGATCAAVWVVGLCHRETIARMCVWVKHSEGLDAL